MPIRHYDIHPNIVHHMFIKKVLGPAHLWPMQNMGGWDEEIAPKLYGITVKCSVQVLSVLQRCEDASRGSSIPSMTIFSFFLTEAWWTDGSTDGQMDGRTDGRTGLVIEMQGRI